MTLPVNYPPRSDAPPVLVGREREEAMLRGHLAASLGERGSLVLIGGEAGIGKTALAEALCQEAREADALILTGRCYDLSETPPYGPWLEIFGQYSPRDDRPSLPIAFARRGTISNVESQAALFQQVQDFLNAVTASRPLVLLLDDLHWADPASLDLLRSITRTIVGIPILLIVTPGGAVSDVVTGLTSVSWITLGPDGLLYIVEFGVAAPNSGRILRVLADGTKQVVADGLNDPNGVAFDTAGNLSVAVNGSSAPNDGPLGQILRIDGVAKVATASQPTTASSSTSASQSTGAYFVRRLGDG